MNSIRNVSLFLLIFAFLQLACGNKEIKEKTESLKNIAIPIKSIDPIDEDYSDLQFLKKIIERDSVQVIMLGEANHGDGSTFLAKSRIIKFLHKEAGFDVLAFESGLYDCTSGWDRIKESGKYYEEIRRAVFPVWVGTKECEDLLDYLQSTLTTPRPLELSGFDSQITGYSYQNCRVFCEELMKVAPDLLTQREENFFVKLACLEEEVKYGLNKTYNTSVLDKMCYKMDSLALLDDKYQYWKQLVYGVRATYKSTITYNANPDSDNPDMDFSERDKQMGNNLIWLLNNKYKNRKVIVWAASFHISRNLQEMKVYNDSLSFVNNMYKRTTTMGDVVYKARGNKMYSVFFTAYTGTGTNIIYTTPFVIEDASDVSIENIIKGLGNEYSFIDLRNPQNPEWIKQSFISRPLGYREMVGKWSKVNDGIFFIKEMEPSNFH
jgi:erythromycin esterase